MKRFGAFLVGQEVVPPVQTLATGKVVLRVSRDGKKIFFRLVVRNIRKMTKAHIHLGRLGQNGPIVATLFGPSKFGISVKHGVVEGTLTAKDLTGPLKGKTIQALVTQIEKGNAYVDVATVRHPNGEIRGQLVRALPPHFRHKPHGFPKPFIFC
ncbi:CHRD domain-containing protein [Paenibacillus sp. J31TS4]|nr:CHRD domain-containing protein [Paenibacillus sp. J31TS4]